MCFWAKFNTVGFIFCSWIATLGILTNSQESQSLGAWGVVVFSASVILHEVSERRH